MPKKCVGVELIAIFNPGVTPSKSEPARSAARRALDLGVGEGSRERRLAKAN